MRLDCNVFFRQREENQSDLCAVLGLDQESRKHRPRKSFIFKQKEFKKEKREKNSNEVIKSRLKRESFVKKISFVEELANVVPPKRKLAPAERRC